MLCGGVGHTQKCQLGAFMSSLFLGGGSSFLYLQLPLISSSLWRSASSEVDESFQNTWQDRLLVSLGARLFRRLTKTSFTHVRKVVDRIHKCNSHSQIRASYEYIA